MLLYFLVWAWRRVKLRVVLKMRMKIDKIELIKLSFNSFFFWKKKKNKKIKNLIKKNKFNFFFFYIKY